MCNIIHEDCLLLNTLSDTVNRSIELLEDFEWNPAAYTTPDLENAVEDVEIMRNVLWDLGWESELSAFEEIENAADQIIVKHDEDITLIAESYFPQYIESELRNQNIISTKLHPWLKVNEEAAKNSYREILVDDVCYYVKKEDNPALKEYST